MPLKYHRSSHIFNSLINIKYGFFFFTLFLPIFFLFHYFCKNKADSRKILVGGNYLEHTAGVEALGTSCFLRIAALVKFFYHPLLGA